ncbi:uncharacterized protein LOC132383423 [Hypanus sabinus]|uniref:uncharacterized protein LOC132383423 n=1 Tax=Hypanus sabinus TaxID=79690 RepID=UPI0028C4A67E|nr:uncharacterized protein LOC132383423 [Hypanus sabinus]XP_059810350.1 uncharacterized protein LOC132383423 [Hypanus sabinus]
MALHSTWSALWKILNRVLNWWRLMLVPKLKPTIEPLSYWTTKVEFQEPIPISTNGKLYASLTIPSETGHSQIAADQIIQKFIRLQEESKESTKRIIMIENDIESIKLEIAKIQTEWQNRQQEIPTEYSRTKGQPYVECSDQRMRTRDMDLPWAYKMPKETQAQNFTCRQRRDYSINDEVDYPCNFLPQSNKSSQTELIPFTGGLPDKHYITEMPLYSLPCGSTRFTSVTSYHSYRHGSLLYRFNTAVRSVQPLKAYAPHSILDLKIGHRVKIILPIGKVGTGVLRYMGMLPGAPEVCFGVELEFPENGLHNGEFAGHCYFHCKPNQGIFVNFSKILMILE